VYISEVHASGELVAPADYIELHNANGSACSLHGWTLCVRFKAGAGAGAGAGRGFLHVSLRCARRGGAFMFAFGEGAACSPRRTFNAVPARGGAGTRRG
jgi:hypothetical protein